MRVQPTASALRTPSTSTTRYHRLGIGDAILSDLIARARAIGHRTIVAGIDAGQAASVAIHAKHGFEKVGHLRDVGYKFERWLDVVYMQLVIGG